MAVPAATATRCATTAGGASQLVAPVVASQKKRDVNPGARSSRQGAGSARYDDSAVTQVTVAQSVALPSPAGLPPPPAASTRPPLRVVVVVVTADATSAPSSPRMSRWRAATADLAVACASGPKPAPTLAGVASVRGGGGGGGGRDGTLAVPTAAAASGSTDAAAGWPLQVAMRATVPVRTAPSRAGNASRRSSSATTPV